MTERWKKSSKSGSGQGSNCVEINDTLTAVRNSRNPDAALRFDGPGAVSRLLATVERLGQ